MSHLNRKTLFSLLLIILGAEKIFLAAIGLTTWTRVFFLDFCLVSQIKSDV
jgi:hypothetical protein